MPKNKIEIAADERFAALVGGTILKVGKPVNLNCEGGGLAFEYIPSDGGDPRVLVIEFNELGCWLSRRVASNPGVAA